MITLSAFIHFMGKSLSPVFHFTGLPRSGQMAGLEAPFSICRRGLFVLVCSGVIAYTYKQQNLREK